MKHWLAGFTDELIKLAEASPDEIRQVMRQVKSEDKKHPTNKKMLTELRGHGSPVSRDYLASIVIGGLSAPALAIAGKGISRAVHNRSVYRAAASAKGKAQKRQILSQLLTGKLIGRGRPDIPVGARPLVAHGDVAGEAARGALMGSVVQMIRDRFSGAARSGDKG